MTHAAEMDMHRVATNSPKLLDQLRLRLRTSHYSYRTEQAYCRWVEKFLRYHREQNGGVWRHPREMGKADVEQYLTDLTVQQNVSQVASVDAVAATGVALPHELEFVWQPGWRNLGPGDELTHGCLLVNLQCLRPTGSR